MKKVCFLFPILLFTLSSCTHFYYMPNQHNVPLFHEKNEVRISGAYSIGDAAKGFEIQGGYAVTKNVAVLANVCVINPYKNADGSGQLYELGAGYYKPFAKHFVFENYGFVGFGQSKGVFRIDSMPSEIVNAGFIKIFDQPSIGFSHNIFDFILSEKIGFLGFYKIGSNTTAITNSNVSDDIQRVTKNRNSFFIEPAATIRIGYKWAKLNAQIGYTFLSNEIRERSGSWNFNLGISISLAPRFGKK